LPLFSLRLGFPDDGNNRKSETSRQAYDLLTSGFGPGFNGPLLLVTDLRGASDVPGTLSKLTDAVKGSDGVAFVSPAITNPAGDTAIINVFSKNKPQDKPTSQLVNRLRKDVLPATLQGTGARVFVGGFTAISIDQSTYIGHRLPLFIGSVVLLSFLLLTTVFRSPLVALKAGIMNMLSIAAAYGVMSYSVHGTWLGKLFNIPETPVPAFVPMIMFAILFGLSMDYEVFLVTRMRETWDAGADNVTAVAYGLERTGRIITAAAIIMCAAFSGFIAGRVVGLQEFGLGLAVAIFVDATIVRSLLVPSLMAILGRWNWWLPAPFARVVRVAPSALAQRP
jgi:RND superfamily putative drug exporter